MQSLLTLTLVMELCGDYAAVPSQELETQPVSSQLPLAESLSPLKLAEMMLPQISRHKCVFFYANVILFWLLWLCNIV